MTPKSLLATVIAIAVPVAGSLAGWLWAPLLVERFAQSPAWLLPALLAGVIVLGLLSALVLPLIRRPRRTVAVPSGQGRP